ncbi:MAG: ribonuclease P protein component [Bacteroidia bacterium]|nr:ribonuclease P protein component [Bacteroidia bacterium]MCF8426870.1 ribonuclease P protein component [Bacteroidia bacterium]
MAPNGLLKVERVRAKKTIDSLFGKASKAIIAYPFRFSWVWLEPNSLGNCSVLFISSKKKLKSAVDRNRRKRLLKELYRLNKTPLVTYLSKNGLNLALSINFVGSETLDFHLHTPLFQKAINKLLLELQKNNTSTLPPTH